jgi:hypothetical protein
LGEIGVFADDFNKNFKAMLAKTPENRQLNIDNVKLDIEY